MGLHEEEHSVSERSEGAYLLVVGLHEEEHSVSEGGPTFSNGSP